MICITEQLRGGADLDEEGALEKPALSPSTIAIIRDSSASAILIIILMGVTGAGKTTVGRLLAAKLRWQFADADDFHSPESVAKMRAGIPLSDSDRAPWLEALHNAVTTWAAEHKNVVLACSALKHVYRDELRTPETRFVYLKGSYALIAARLRDRHGHFATESILNGQFADLQEPENAIMVTVDQTPEDIASELVLRLQLAPQEYPDATQP